MNTFPLFKSITSTCILIAGIILPNISYAFHPCIELTKEVSADGGLSWHDANTEAEAVSISNGAVYKFTVTGCYPGYDYDLTNILIEDDILQVYESLPNKTIDLGDQSISITIDASEICSGYEGTLENTASVSTTAIDVDGGIVHTEYLTDSDNAWIRCEPVQAGGDGCTPGYWKQPHHFDSWPAVVTPDSAYSSVFDRIITIRVKGEGLVADPTLLQALSALGGKINTAARHSTAAYLNSMTNDVSYDLNSDQVIDNLQQSIDSSDFGTLIEALVSFNEQGCPLN